MNKVIRMAVLGVLALGLVGGFILCGVSAWAQKAKPPSPPPPAADPAIAYVEEAGWGKTDLVVINADGSNKKILVNGLKGTTTGNHDPNWSPDGNWIVFGRTAGGTGADSWISKIRKDGTGLCNIVPTEGIPCWGDGMAKWLPLRSMVSFYDSGSLIFSDAACGSGTLINMGMPLQPTWAPYDLRFAALVDEPAGSGDWDIFIFELVEDPISGWKAIPKVNLTDSGPLANAALRDLDWAKSSDKIAVAARLPNADAHDIWVIDLNDPFNPVNLTNSADIPEIEPSWSPDDTQIVYLRNNSLYVMNCDGTNVKRIATTKLNLTLRAPDWRRNR